MGWKEEIRSALDIKFTSLQLALFKRCFGTPEYSKLKQYSNLEIVI